MSDFLIKLFNKKVLFSFVFLGFTVFWGLDFSSATFHLIVFPLAFFIQSKNNSYDKGGAFKDYRFIVQTTLIIVISYLVFMVQYLSMPNTNKLIQTQELQKGSYYIPEYKSVRTRSDSVLFLKNNKGGQAIVCSFVHWGDCPHYDSYDNDIYVEFITPRRNFRQIILGYNAVGVAYHIHHKDTITDKAYFIKKYNDEFKSIYLFLISLNIYMGFLLYIKYNYDIKIRHSFKVVFSKISDGAFCIFMTLFVCIYLFVFFKMSYSKKPTQKLAHSLLFWRYKDKRQKRQPTWIVFFVVQPYDLPNGLGLGVLGLDGGRIGCWNLGCSPVKVFKNATTSASSSSVKSLLS